MSRPSNTSTEITTSQLDDGRLMEAQNAAQQLTTLNAAYGEERDIAVRLLGRMEMVAAFSKFTDVVSLTQLKYIKENKIYRGLSGKTATSPSGEEITDVGTWLGFCKAIGKSASKVDEDLLNFNAFGEEALNQLNAVGIGYRDLRQFRRLQDDEKVLLIEAAKAGDKDSLVEFAETLISKHTKEREALVTQVSDLRANVVAAEDVSKGKQKKINELTRNVEKFSLDKEWPAQTTAAIDTVNKYAAESERFLGVVMQACTQAMEAAPNDDAGQQVWAQGAAALAARVRDVMARQKEVIAAADSHFLMTLNQYLED